MFPHITRFSNNKKKNNRSLSLSFKKCKGSLDVLTSGGLCSIIDRKSASSLSLLAVAELFPVPKNYVVITRSPNTADHHALYASLKAYGRFTGLCWLMSPEPAPQAKLPVPTIEEIIYSEEFIQTRGAQQQLECLVHKAKITEADILLVSQITVGQRDNPAWYLARRGRLPASNFGSVLLAKTSQE